MRMFVTTAAMMAALTVSAFAEGDLLGTEAQGEANGSFKASIQQPTAPILQDSLGQQAMAQGSLPSDKSKAPKISKTKHLNAKGAASHASAIKASAKGNSVKQNKDELYNDTGYSPESLKSPTGMDGGNRK
jgi:hypothetical protein